MVSTRMRGLSEAYGSWKIICTASRAALASRTGERRPVLALEQHLAFARLQQAGDHAAERRLAAARLADQADHLAAGDRQADVVDGVHDSPAHLPAPSRAGSALGQVGVP